RLIADTPRTHAILAGLRQLESAATAARSDPGQDERGLPEFTGFVPVDLDDHPGERRLGLLFRDLYAKRLGIEWNRRDKSKRRQTEPKVMWPQVPSRPGDPLGNQLLRQHSHPHIREM